MGDFIKLIRQIFLVRLAILVCLWLLLRGESYMAVAQESSKVAPEKEIDYFQIKKSPQQRVDDSYEQFKRQSTVDGALTNWEDRVGKKAKAKPYYNIGNILFEEGRYKEAVEYYKKAISIDPEDKESYYNLGVIYDCFLPDNKKAVYYFSQYLKLAIDATDASYVRNRISQIRIRSKLGISKTIRSISDGADKR